MSFSDRPLKPEQIAPRSLAEIEVSRVLRRLRHGRCVAFG